MTTAATPDLTETAAKFEARRIVAAALGVALRDPRALAGAAGPTPPAPREILLSAWEFLASAHAGIGAGALGLGEASPAGAEAGSLASWLDAPLAERLAVHQRVYGLVIPRDCPPYASEYCPSRDAFHRSQYMADVAAFYNAFGLRLDSAFPERCDHVSLQLAFLAFLLEKLRDLALAPACAERDENAEVCAGALAAFVRDHVAWWMPTFARNLERRVEGVLASGVDGGGAAGSLLGVARLLRAWGAAERIACGVEPARRIVQPDIDAYEPGEDECGGCDSCSAPPD